MATEFDSVSLSECDGKNGRAAYVGHDGRVFDVSKSGKWKNGLHMNRHQAGQDLSADMKSAPHGPEVLERFEEVGKLAEAENGPPMAPGMLGRLIDRFPFLRRHPHPMTVHFPIALMMLAPVFHFLGLLTGVPSFYTTSLHCLGAGLAFSPVTILTGYYTWWLNYDKASMKPVRIKKILSISMFFLGLILFLWHLFAPPTRIPFGWAAAAYSALLILLIPCVVVIGWHGAMLTFPLEE